MDIAENVVQAYRQMIQQMEGAVTTRDQLRLMLKMSAYQLNARTIFTANGNLRPNIKELLHIQAHALIPHNTSNPGVTSTLLLNWRQEPPPEEKTSTTDDSPEEVRRLRESFLRKDVAVPAAAFVRPDGTLRSSRQDIERYFA